VVVFIKHLPSPEWKNHSISMLFVQRHFVENDQTFARKATSNFSQISFASHHHRNDLIGGSGTGFGGVLLQPKHAPAEQHGVAKNTSSRARSGKSRNYKRKKNGGKRKWNGEKKKRRSNTGSESRQSVWSNREMRVGPYHDHTRRNSGSGQYMRISTLNPEIRHVGGAEITYN